MKRLGTLAAAQANGFGGPMVSNGLRLSRKLSKREKKEQKKREQEAQAKGTEPGGSLYNELPESVLTRSISNPEMVMRKRRELKLEKKLQQIRTSDGGPESGGTLKIYGGTICPEVPYKTLLLSERDRADYVVKETLDKYGLGRDDPRDYCLVQVITPYRSDDYYADAKPVEYILNDNDYPLDLLIHAPPVQGQVTFFTCARRSPNEMRRWNTEVRQPMPPGSPSWIVPPSTRQYPTPPCVLTSCRTSWRSTPTAASWPARSRSPFRSTDSRSAVSGPPPRECHICCYAAVPSVGVTVCSVTLTPL